MRSVTNVDGTTMTKNFRVKIVEKITYIVYVNDVDVESFHHLNELNDYLIDEAYELVDMDAYSDKDVVFSDHEIEEAHDG